MWSHRNHADPEQSPIRNKWQLILPQPRSKDRPAKEMQVKPASFDPKRQTEVFKLTKLQDLKFQSQSSKSQIPIYKCGDLIDFNPKFHYLTFTDPNLASVCVKDNKDFLYGNH